MSIIVHLMVKRCDVSTYSSRFLRNTFVDPLGSIVAPLDNLLSRLICGKVEKTRHNSDSLA